MEWWQILLLTAIVAAIGVAGEVYLRLSPQRERRKEEKHKAQKTIENQLNEISTKAEMYRSIALSHLQEFSDNRYISTKLRKALTSIIDLGKKYEDWRLESWRIVNSEARRMAQSNELEKLNKSLRALIGGGVYDVFSGYEGHFSEPIYQAIYEGNLTFEVARDSVLKHRWDSSTKVDEETVRLKDVVESGEFHKLIEELQQLHNRESLKMLREVRKTLLENAKPILKEIT